MRKAKRKEIPDGKQKEIPDGKRIIQWNDPEHFYPENPAWSFANIDSEMWTFSQNHIGRKFWTEILPYLQALETQTWKDILLIGKKQNHSLNPNDLNRVAQERLADMRIEAESLISLRLSGKQRIYGFMTGRVFNLLWYDDDHGDNLSCVCRSHLKHT